MNGMHGQSRLLSYRHMQGKPIGRPPAKTFPLHPQWTFLKAFKTQHKVRAVYFGDIHDNGRPAHHIQRESGPFRSGRLSNTGIRPQKLELKTNGLQSGSKCSVCQTGILSGGDHFFAYKHALPLATRYKLRRRWIYNEIFYPTTDASRTAFYSPEFIKLGANVEDSALLLKYFDRDVSRRTVNQVRIDYAGKKVSKGETYDQKEATCSIEPWNFLTVSTSFLSLETRLSLAETFHTGRTRIFRTTVASPPDFTTITTLIQGEIGIKSILTKPTIAALHPQNPYTKTFLDLPLELRNTIYSLTLPQNQTIHVSRRRIFIITSPEIPHHEPALLQSHPKIRAEALAMYYSTNTFQMADEISAMDDAVSLVRELRIQPDQLRRSRSGERWIRNRKVKDGLDPGCIRIGVVVQPAVLGLARKWVTLEGRRYDLGHIDRLL
ncbi:uncharacterized protein MYCFIDRAFT_209005 [Pseudocercospora fijiensis CIRAD86]|uniref:Uncharacterized protein n=1 Tax=Pseudocercospora fijiensis (strain CIRAD86) TaxID=383855 RepID=M2ZHF2_PSEFD|nr:uncharacterized protein MYCFIDRAFT_209005 [Pseudocercospora fijiensis CIRAD86]EME78564.1 hypothetical protein MYCFIDRAFT_209005 [Pseudocercospora fijiensis CIRAD86]